MYKHIKLNVVAVLLSMLLPIYALATEVYFSPQGGTQKRIVELINGAKKSVDVAMYGFTSPEIAKALVKAKKRSVQVRILLDRTQAGGRESQSGYLRKRGLAVRFDHQSGIMHNKVGLIDSTVLITGSYNWTMSAEYSNQENCLILTTKDDPNIIQQYQQRFEYIWQLNEPRFVIPNIKQVLSNPFPY